MYRKNFKRMIDVVISILAVMFLLPVLVVITMSYLPIPGSILFYQFRLGCNNPKFRMLKFRTLSSDGKEFLFGRFLRITSLDELPQLWNILKGDMSLVGPRPLPLEYLSYFTKEQKRRFQVKPGITGLAQVNGRTSISWDKKLKYDVEYVEKRSFWLDLKILFKTVLVVLFERNTNSLEEISFIDYVKASSRASPLKGVIKPAKDSELVRLASPLGDRGAGHARTNTINK